MKPFLDHSNVANYSYISKAAVTLLMEQKEVPVSEQISALAEKMKRKRLAQAVLAKKLYDELTQARAQVDDMKQQFQEAETAASKTKKQNKALSDALATLSHQFETTQANELQLASACEEFEALKASTGKTQEELAQLKDSSRSAFVEACQQQAALVKRVKQLEADKGDLGQQLQVWSSPLSSRSWTLCGCGASGQWQRARGVARRAQRFEGERRRHRESRAQ